MTTTIHKNLTGADLHEPKGAATALSGMVYVADGAGSGAWTPASNVITNTAFTTGDLKPTHKTSADASWILWSDGTIGDGSSSASIRANADTAALFTLYWANSNCLISGGKGVSAAADYAAHKAISLPPGAGRVLGLAGSGSGLTARTLGQTVGEETHVLTVSELAAHNHTINDPGHGHVASVRGGGSPGTTIVQGGSVDNETIFITVDTNTTGITINNNGSNGAHNNMQPTAFVNVMIKL